MKANQTNLIKMANMAIDLFNGNAAIVALIAGLQNVIDGLKTLLADIAKQVEAQNTDSKVATEKTKELKNELATQADFVLKEMKAYATVKKDSSVYADIDYTFYELAKMPNQKMKDVVAAISSKASGLAAELVAYNITETILANLKTANDNFTANINKPKQAIIEHSVATQNIDADCEKLKDMLDDMDMLIGPFEKLQPDFYNKYKTIREMTAGRTYFTSVQITVADATTGKALKGVAIACVHEDNTGANVTFVTNKYGRNRKEKLTSGNYVNSYSLPGYQAITGKMAIVDSQTTAIEVKMKAIE
jgi:hypothetical protein